MDKTKLKSKNNIAETNKFQNGSPSKNGVNKTEQKEQDISNKELIEQLKLQCSLANKEACTMCSS